ncbi:pogo transposable [Stemphylium lycopersici]|uniref:Pogo transposable n=1 Tax=Stemphylium lycopersici TaxID=183478 RepID=A0A364MR65_STELY|nr:pogo transposable [Stemphylium lycopersici]RAQ98900.1 pogo transposable [Stemphylium lycopersici]
MAKERAKADSRAKYNLYFKLLHEKIEEYNIQPIHIFNMDEKGFQLGRVGNTKRIFSRRLYEQKGARQALEDGSSEWITVIACICSDGKALSPTLIFQGANGAVQSSWVEAVQAGEHSVFTTSSPSGWSNNDIGLAWPKGVFKRETRRSSCLCYPLTLLIRFNPWTFLMGYLQDSQGLLNLTKGNFFPLFWRAWVNVFKPPLIKKSFEATGIYPANPDVILKKFAKEASDSDSSQSVLSGEDWLKLKSTVRREVKDQSSKDVKKLQRSLCHISAQNSILREEVRGLRQSLAIKERRSKQSFTLQLDEDEVYHGGAKLWSPRSVQRARDRRASQQQQAELEKLQKAEQAKIKKAARDCELQLKAVKRVEREKGWEESRKRKAAEKAERDHCRSLRNAAKAIKLPQSGKRKASQPHPPATKRQKRGGVAPAVVGAARVARAAPPRSRRQRPITPSKKLSE